MLLEEGYSSDSDQGEEWTVENSDDHDDNTYQEVVEQPRKHLRGITELFKCRT